MKLKSLDTILGYGLHVIFYIFIFMAVTKKERNQLFMWIDIIRLDYYRVYLHWVKCCGITIQNIHGVVLSEYIILITSTVFSITYAIIFYIAMPRTIQCISYLFAGYILYITEKENNSLYLIIASLILSVVGPAVTIIRRPNNNNFKISRIFKRTTKINMGFVLITFLNVLMIFLQILFLRIINCNISRALVKLFYWHFLFQMVLLNRYIFRSIYAIYFCTTDNIYFRKPSYLEIFRFFGIAGTASFLKAIQASVEGLHMLLLPIRLSFGIRIPRFQIFETNHLTVFYAAIHQVSYPEASDITRNGKWIDKEYICVINEMSYLREFFPIILMNCLAYDYLFKIAFTFFSKIQIFYFICLIYILVIEVIYCFSMIKTLLSLDADMPLSVPDISDIPPAEDVSISSLHTNI